ncbi:olfactory receptor 52N5-like [Pagrus major]|uniref:olfactory receptor 52N5-like n=1 Tax=Pagrus major TaxID=143350 RepID=UPI003CC83C7F
MENYTYNSDTLQLEGLNVSKDFTYPLFLFLFFSYLFIIVANLSIAVLVFIDKNLHQPMYLLFCNLSVNDILGNSILPRLLVDMLLPPSERLISYYECVVQAFTVHVCSTCSHTVLMIMAFDRYVAICNPLRYATIMTNKMLIKLTVSAWGVAFVLVGILLGLTIRLNRCRTIIRSPYCNNASLFKLSCENVFINNIYGLSMTWSVSTGIFLIVAFSYFRILLASVKQNRTDSVVRSKAFQTCASHLVVYVLYEIASLVIIVSYRFPSVSGNMRKFLSIMCIIIPPAINPIIYGLVSKEIRESIIKHFSKLVCHKK